MYLARSHISNAINLWSLKNLAPWEKLAIPHFLPAKLQNRGKAEK